MRRCVAAVCAVLALLTGAAGAQQTPPMPRDYRGVQVHVDGIFVTPIANAPFTAEVQIVSHEKLPDGTEHIVMTRNHIARSSSGVIRNERRRLVTTAFKGEPRLLSVHLYDPSTRVSTFFDPMTHLARQMTLPAPPRVPPDQRPSVVTREEPGVTITDLGTQPLDGVELKGLRKSRTVPAELSGTGQPVEVTDEYWYSPDLAIYMTIRHNDPRTGEQLVAVTKVDRHEPPVEDVTVPSDYKIVDETPPERELPSTNATAAEPMPR